MRSDDDARIDDLVRRLEDSDWRSMLWKRPVGVGAALRRCAAVRTFDSDLFTDMAGTDPEPDTPSLDDLLDAGDIEPLPDRPEEYRVPSHARLQFLRWWWPDQRVELRHPVPDALQEFSAGMASRYRKEERPLDELYELLLADPPAARELFERLFAELDERFDLVGCQALLDLLSLPERAPFLPDAFCELRDERQQYLRARKLWALEHWQIGRFLEPDGARARFDALLDGGAGRLLHLWARGGMGKTMLLRWLIADLCVPRGIPCARIDLDLVNPATACDEPWLMLLELAHQLDQQLPGLPFRELLREQGHLRALLGRAPTPAAAAAATVLDNPAERDRIAHDVLARFRATCNDAALLLGSQPILLVFDTLEEILVRADASAELDSLIDLISSLHDRCPALRLVLSGRYDLCERVPSFTSRFPTAEHWEVQPFSEVQGRSYLEETRGIERTALVDVIVGRAEGLPLTLALFADVVQEDPSIEPEALATIESPHQVHLILRVVARIEDRRVRWLLRYGVVPRVLSFAFARDVMLPHLQSGMSGGSDLDAPERDPVPPLRGPAVDALFPTDLLPPGAELDLGDVWTKLLRFAGRSSWVSEASGQEAVRFHPTVLGPMRRMLEGHAVFKALHRAAIDHFEERAREEPEQWLQWTCEAVYHRFQVEGAAAGEYWRERLETARRRRQPQWRRRLAGEILGREYIDSTGKVRLRGDGSPMISDETRILACYEAARVDAELALTQRAGSAHQQWASVRRGLSELSRLPVEAVVRVVTPAQLAWLSAAVKLSQGQAVQAEADVRVGLEAAEASERPGLANLAAEAAAAAGRREAIELFRRARGESARVGDRDAELTALRREAEEAAQWDRLDVAVDGVRQVLRADAARHAEITPKLATFLIRAGEPAAALATVADARRRPDVHPDVLAELHRCAALANLALFRPLAALGDCQEAIAAAKDDESPAAMAEAYEVLGRALAALKQFRQGLTALEHASRLWQQAGRTEEACGCHVRFTQIVLHDCGNLRDADRALRTARRFEINRGDVWLGRWLCSIELEAAHGRQRTAGEYVEQLLDSLDSAPAPPRFQVRAAVAALAVLPTASAELFLQLLVACASDVAPAAALCPLLEGLSRVPTIPGRPSPLRLLRAMLAGERASASGPRTDEDTALLRMTSAEVNRIMGASRVASSQLTQSALVLGRSAEPYVWLRWLEAANRLPLSPTATPRLDASAFTETYREHRALCAAFHIELTGRHLRDDRRRSASESLASAGAALQAVKLRTSLAARVSELSGMIEERWGDPAVAAVHTRQAAIQYAELGDDPERERLLTLADRQAFSRAVPAREVIPMALTARLAVDGTSEGAAPAARLETTATVRSGREVHWNAPLEAVVPLGYRGMVDQLGLAERLAREPAGLGQALGTALLPGPAASLVADVAAGDEPAEIRLAIVDPRLHGIPWELAGAGALGPPIALTPGVSRFYRFFSEATSAHHDWRQLQWALNQLRKEEIPVDGLGGPVTWDALRSFRAGMGLGSGGLDERVWLAVETAMAEATPPRPLTVALLRPTRQREDERARGAQSSGVDVQALYRAAGFEVTLFENPSQDGLESWAEEAADEGWTPDVIHIATSLDTTQSAAFLDFAAAPSRGPEARPSRAAQVEQLFVTVLDRIMQVLGDGRPPVLVLDVARPTAPTEAARHLILRNEFAGQLFSLGSTPLLLAMGPARPGDLERIYKIMIRRLAAGDSVGEVCQAIRAEAGPGSEWSPGRLDAVLAFAGTALFAHRAAAGLRRVR